ncbi:poly-beta-1,6-N-acetyl-D-glucosamine biosynthesis protein PgaD [Niallia sp. 03133]|uniref:poly-beta-1,6-N-acetyl-D-glucosamine biosynthesis protein PgaD n=1 Tax=Niallia sp. 03133 TaxID=3458060 RepID=UPI004044505A
MEQSRSRFDEKQQIIISDKQPFVRFIISLFFTAFFWVYSLFVVWFFTSALIGVNDRYSGVLKIAFKTVNSEIRSFVYISILIFFFFLISLFFWRLYNKKRFGSLNRRKPVGKTTINDLENLGLLSKESIEVLQQARYIEFQVNPLKDVVEDKKIG